MGREHTQDSDLLQRVQHDDSQRMTRRIWVIACYASVVA